MAGTWTWSWDLDLDIGNLGMDIGNLGMDVGDDGFLEKGLRFGRGQFLVGYHVLELMHRVDCCSILWGTRVSSTSGRDNKGILHKA